MTEKREHGGGNLKAQPSANSGFNLPLVLVERSSNSVLRQHLSFPGDGLVVDPTTGSYVPVHNGIPYRKVAAKNAGKPISSATENRDGAI